MRFGYKKPVLRCAKHPDREAKYINFGAYSSYFAIGIDRDSAAPRRVGDLTTPVLAASVLACGLDHGAAKRNRYSVFSEDRWLPLADYPEVVALAKQYYVILDERKAAEAAESAAKEKERVRGLVARYWREYENDPDYEITYFAPDDPAGDPWYIRRHTHVWLILPVGADPKDSRPLGQSFQVDIDLNDRYSDMLAPAEVRVSQTGGLSPKLAVKVAEALTAAAALVAKINAERKPA